MSLMHLGFDGGFKIQFEAILLDRKNKRVRVQLGLAYCETFALVDT